MDSKKVSCKSKKMVDEQNDKFYSSSNMRALKESIDELKKGKVVKKTFEELEQLTNESK